MVSIDDVRGDHGEPIHQDVFFASMVTAVLLGLVAVYSVYANALAMRRAREGHEAAVFFVASRELGLSETMMASFSPMFGGAVMVLLPMEVAWKGLGVGCRWFSLLGAIVVPCFILNPMIRTLAIARGHVSPIELVQDRYRSHLLTVLLAAVLVTSLFFACGTQLLAVKTMLLALTNDLPEAQKGTILVCIVAAFCDFFGGFRGVSRIDTCQMFTTIACAVVVAQLVQSNWALSHVFSAECAAGEPGANQFQAQSLVCQYNATEYPCVDGCGRSCARSEPIDCLQMMNLSTTLSASEMFFAMENASGIATCTRCVQFNAQCSGCYSSAWVLDSQVTKSNQVARDVSAATVDFASLVRQPHAWQGDYAVWKVLSLVLMVGAGGHGGSLAPHVFQRVVSADSDRTLKQSLLPILPAAWITLLIGLVYGITWMALHGPEFNFADDGTVLPGAAGPKQPLAGIFDDLIDLGGTEKVFGLIALSAAVSSLLTAASMTSMGCGSVISIGVVQNLLWPIIQWGDARGDVMKGAGEDAGDGAITLDGQTVILSKVISVICLFIALGTIALSDDTDLSEMFDWTVGLFAHGSPALWYCGIDMFYLGRHVHSIALTLGLVFGLLGTVIIQFYILTPDEDGRSPELVLSAAAWGVLINWLFTLWFILTLPGSLADTRQNRPKPSWLNWDAPTPQYLRKYGKNFLTFNEADRICTKYETASHQQPIVLGGLLAFVITVASLPWFDGGGETTAGLYRPPVPDSIDYLFGLPRYVIIQIGGALVATLIYIGIVYKFWSAPDHAVSGRLGAINVKPLGRMTAQDVSTWLFQFHQDERPRRDSEGNLVSLAWGLVLDHYIHVLRQNEVDGAILRGISKTKLSAVSALVDKYGIADQEHATCIAAEIHQLKDKGWVTEDSVYSREWESKLKEWSRAPLDERGCATPLVPRALNGPKTVTSKEVKRLSVSEGGGVEESNAPTDDRSKALKHQHYSIGRLDLADTGDSGSRANPLKHNDTKMYLRWDPYATDRASMLGESAWTNVMSRLRIGNEVTTTTWLLDASGNTLDAQNGLDRVNFLFEFEKFTQPWEHASEHVVPWRPNDLSRRNLTYMLHSKATKTAHSASGDAIPATWAVRHNEVDTRMAQGRMSRICQIKCKYHDENGATKPGPRSLIAKFLPRQREFLKTRRDNGVGGYNVFGTEVFVYEHELVADLGIPQPKSYFEAHDPQRDCFCILMQDLQSAGFSAGDELSELGEHYQGHTGAALPNVPLYAELVRVLADFNSSRYNTSQGAWTSSQNEEFDLETTLLGFDSPRYIAISYRQLKENFSIPERGDQDTLFQDTGFKELCGWLGFTEGVEKCYTAKFEKGVTWMMENQELFKLASRSRENGGWLDCGIVHGDCRIDNIWFPTPPKTDSEEKYQTDPTELRSVDGQCARFIDFQHVKRGCHAYDVTVFLAHSVPTSWRRENEMQLLSLYFDAIKASPGHKDWADSHPGEELTWEIFILQVQFCLLHYMVSVIVVASTTVPAFEQIDPRRFFRGGTFVRRFLEMLDDWSPKPKKTGNDLKGVEYAPPIQMIIEAAAQRSREAGEQGPSEEADWQSLRAKWVREAQEALTSEQGEGILPKTIVRGYVPKAQRDAGAKRTERFASLDQDEPNNRKTTEGETEVV